MAKGALHQEEIAGQSYWLPHASTPVSANSPVGLLLPNYDEVLASFKDYRAGVKPEHERRWTGGDRLFPHYLVIDGWVVGTWRRTVTKRAVTVETRPFTPLAAAEVDALIAAAQRYGDFLALPIELQHLPPDHLGS